MPLQKRGPRAMTTHVAFAAANLPYILGAGMAQWKSAGLAIERSRVRVPAGAVGEFSSPGSTFCADSFFGGWGVGGGGIRSTPDGVTAVVD